MDTVRISVPLSIAEAEKLIALAKRQRRHTRDQAAFMLAEMLRDEEKAKEPERTPRAEGRLN